MTGLANTLNTNRHKMPPGTLSSFIFQAKKCHMELGNGATPQRGLGLLSVVLTSQGPAIHQEALGAGSLSPKCKRAPLPTLLLPKQQIVGRKKRVLRQIGPLSSRRGPPIPWGWIPSWQKLWNSVETISVTLYNSNNQPRQKLTNTFTISSKNTKQLGTNLAKDVQPCTLKTLKHC